MGPSLDGFDYRLVRSPPENCSMQRCEGQCIRETRWSAGRAATRRLNSNAHDGAARLTRCFIKLAGFPACRTDETHGAQFFVVSLMFRHGFVGLFILLLFRRSIALFWPGNRG